MLAIEVGLKECRLWWVVGQRGCASGWRGMEGSGIRAPSNRTQHSITNGTVMNATDDGSAVKLMALLSRCTNLFVERCAAKEGESRAGSSQPCGSWWDAGSAATYLEMVLTKRKCKRQVDSSVIES